MEVRRKNSQARSIRCSYEGKLHCQFVAKHVPTETLEMKEKE